MHGALSPQAEAPRYERSEPLRRASMAYAPSVNPRRQIRVMIGLSLISW